MELGKRYDDVRCSLRVLLGVLLKPRSTLSYLSTARRRWWWVVALLMVAALAAQGFSYSKAELRFSFQRQLEYYESLSVAERQMMFPEPPVEPQASTFTLSTAIGVGAKIVATIATWLVWAGLLYLASTFLGQNRAGFGAFYGIVAWTWIPYVIRNAIQAIAMTLTGSAIYNQGLSGLVIDRTPVPITPIWQPPISPSAGDQVLAAFLARFDVYVIWNLVLLVLGVAALSHLSGKKALLGTLVIWLLFTLLSLLPALTGLNQGFRL
ncbi:MAG: YIP1 family protein [Anaerolineae bacterium]|nr:YIP1 family protein [Anaerolineae bacterium]